MDEKKEPIKVEIPDIRLVAEEVEGGVQVRAYRTNGAFLYQASRTFTAPDSAEGSCWQDEVREVFDKMAARERTDRDVITDHCGRRARMVAATTHRVQLHYVDSGRTCSWTTDVSEWRHSQDCHPALLDFHRRRYLLEPGEYRDKNGNVQVLDVNEFLLPHGDVNVRTFHVSACGAQVLQSLSDGRWGDLITVKKISEYASQDRASGHANGWARVLAAHKAKYPGVHS